jgi:dTDP-4-dehydrorhamnose reductase
VNRPARILIIGDGQISTALAKKLAADGIPYLATTRRPERVSAGKFYLDLALAESAQWEVPEAVDAVFLGAAETRQSACAADPLGSRALNVDATCSLAARLSRAGAHVVFPSTNLVFDGCQPYRKEEDPPSPVSEYGRQKAAAETRLLAEAPGAAIIRLTKVISRDTPLIANWTRTLRSGERISAFTDMVLAPIDQATVVTAIIQLLTRRTGGIFNLSGREDLSYFDFARKIAIKIGISADVVAPTSWRSNPALSEAPPAHTVLSATVAQTALGIEPPSADQALASALSSEVL